MKIFQQQNLILLATLMVIALSLPIAGNAAILSLTDSATDPGFSISTMNSDMNGITVEMLTRGIRASVITTLKGNYTNLSLEEAGITTTIGDPELPVIRKFIQVPFGAEVQTSVIEGKVVRINLQSRSLPDLVYPHQEPVPKIPGISGSIPFAFNNSTYETATPIPSNLVQIKEAGIVRGKRLFMLEVSPLRYNPVSGDLFLYPDITVRIDFLGADINRTEAELIRYSTPAFGKELKTMTLNGDCFDDMDYPDLPVVYLVITPSSFTPYLQEMLQWKYDKGYDVMVATENDISPWTTTGIKNYIQTAYDTWDNPPTFVLLVGDDNQLPAFQGSSSYSVSDLYYVTLEGSDILPDAGIGRFPASSATQLTAMSEKVLSYETMEGVVQSNWFAKAVFMASDDNYNISEATHNYVIENYFEPAGLTCDKIYAHRGGSGSDIRTALNDGRVIANYSGHGSEVDWYNPHFTQTDVRNLDNQGMLPFVVSNACLTGNFEISECYGETWLRTTGNGAIGFWGGSNSTYWDEDDILEKRLWEGFFEDNMKTLAEVTNYAKYRLYEYYGGGGSTHYYFEIYNILGDPSVGIRSHIPWDTDVDYPASIPMGQYDLTVTVTYQGSPVENALVSVTQGESIHTSGYTDAAGVATLRITATSPDIINLKITSPDIIPYEGSIQPISEGPYVTFDDYTIDDDQTGGSYGNGDGEAGPGETLEIPVALKNWGTESAANVTATLSINDPMVTVIDNYETFGNIDPNETEWSLEDFDIQIDPLCEDAHTVTCNLIIDADGNEWESSFTLEVKAPKLDISDYEIDDPYPGGNGNGVLEPGETGTMTISLENNGSLPATSMNAQLILNDPYVTIIVGSSSYPDIAPGETAENTTVYELEVSEDCPSPYTPVATLELTGDWYTDEITFEFLIQGAGFSDDMESGEGDWTHSTITSGYGDQWHLTNARSASGSYSWKCGGSGTGNYGNELDAGLVTPVIILPNNAVLTFNHWINAETSYSDYAYDGGIVEISTDEGTTWEQIDPSGGYPYIINNTYGNPLPDNTRCYSGSSDWSQASFDLSSYSGVVMFRFRFATDSSVTYEGWYIDDVVVTGEGGVTIQLTPDTYTVSRGGTVDITIDLVNETDELMNFQVWTELTLPSGHIFPNNPYRGPVTMTLDPGESYTSVISATIVQNAPLGTYYFEGFVGNYPDSQWDSSGFSLEVVE